MMLPRPVDLPDDHHGGHGRRSARRADVTCCRVRTARTTRRECSVNWTALGFAVASFLLSIALFASFNSGYVNNATGNAMQFLEDVRWITLRHDPYPLSDGRGWDQPAADALTTFLMVLCVLFSFNTARGSRSSWSSCCCSRPA